MARRRPSPEEKARIAEEKAAERRAAIKRIVDGAPPLTMAQCALLLRIFDGLGEELRQRAAQRAAEQQ